MRDALIGALLAAAVCAAVPCRVGAAPAFASMTPTPRTEHWQRRQTEIDRQLLDERALAAVKLLFVGDSITDFWLLDDNPWVKGQKYGRAVWDEAFAGTVADNRALNVGISGDRIEHVLHRLLPRAQGGGGQLDAAALQPEFIVVLLGINNTWAAEEPVADSVFEGLRVLLAALHERRPASRIVVQSLLPTSDAAKNDEVVRPVNARLAALVASPAWAGHALYLDLVPGFVDAQGRQIAALFTDGLHPNRDGYRVWRDRLLPFLERARAARR